MNDRTKLMSVIIRVVAIELGVDESVVTTARSLKKELAMDSVAAANILFQLEEELQVELDAAVVDRVEAVADLEAVLVEAVRRIGSKERYE